MKTKEVVSYTTYEEMQNAWVKALDPKKGDKFKLLMIGDKLNHHLGWKNGWTPNMGQVGEIVEFTKGINRHGVNCKVPYGRSVNGYPYFALQLVERAPKSFKVDLNENYTAEITPGKDTFNVGCQEFSIKKVEEILAIYKGE